MVLGFVGVGSFLHPAERSTRRLQRLSPVACATSQNGPAIHWRKFNTELRRTFQSKGVKVTVEKLLDNEHSSVQNFNQVVTLLREGGDSEIVADLVLKAAETGQADPLTFQLAMQVCLNAKDASAARIVMSSASAMHMNEDGRMIRNFLRCIYESENVHAAREAYNDQGIRPSSPEGMSFLLGTMILLYAEDKKLNDATELLKENAEIEIPARVYNTLLSSISRAGSNQMDEILQLMRSRKVVADIASFNVLLKSFHRAREYEKFQGLLDQMKAQNIQLSSTSYNILIDHYVERGMLDEAEGVFSEMQDAGVRPDRYSFTSMIKAFGRGRDATRAVELLKSMERSSIGADKVAYQTAVHACLGCSKPVLAHEILLKMMEKGIPIKDLYWTWLLEVCISSSDEIRAQAVVREMDRRFLLPERTNILSMRTEIDQLGGFLLISSKLEEWEAELNEVDSL